MDVNGNSVLAGLSLEERLDVIEANLEEIESNQIKILDNQEEIIEKIENMSLPGGNFSVFEER